MLVHAAPRQRHISEQSKFSARSAGTPYSLLGPQPKHWILASKEAYSLAGWPFGLLTSGLMLEGPVLQMEAWIEIRRISQGGVRRL